MGTNHGWAFHKYREFTGREPRGLNQVAATPTQEILDGQVEAIAYAKQAQAMATSAADLTAASEIAPWEVARPAAGHFGIERHLLSGKHSPARLRWTRPVSL